MEYPKLFTEIRTITKEQLLKDISAGVLVGIVALPLAIAFGIASGVSPEKGIITAIIAGFIISAFGGSKVQIGGPTGAFIIIVYGILQEYGMDGLLIATIIAGIILILMGIAKLGSVIKFIPYPVIVGFTSGIALIIFTTQIKDLFGLQISQVPTEFHLKWYAYLNALNTINLDSLFISAIALIIIILWPKKFKVPGTLIAILITTLIVRYFHFNVNTIGSIFGELPSNLPAPKLIEFNLSTIRHLFVPASTIAILAAIESLLSAVVADGMIGSKHRSNMELIAQGAANIITPLFGGIPATGAIARTATNIKNGGRTPIAGIVHALTLLLILLFFGKFATLIPMPTLAAVLVVVSYHMSEWRAFKSLLKTPKSDVIILISTFILTIFFDLTIAIQVGMLLAMVLFMRRMAEVTNVGFIKNQLNDYSDTKPDPNAIQNRKIPEGVEVFEINGPFFFGATSKFQDELRLFNTSPKIIILRMRNVPAIDATGLNTIREFHSNMTKKNIRIILSGVHSQPIIAMTQAGLIDLIGEEYIFGNIDDALDKTRELLDIPVQGRPDDFVATVAREKK